MRPVCRLPRGCTCSMDGVPRGMSRLAGERILAFGMMLGLGLRRVRRRAELLYTCEIRFNGRGVARAQGPRLPMSCPSTRAGKPAFTFPFLTASKLRTTAAPSSPRYHLEDHAATVMTTFPFLCP